MIEPIKKPDIEPIRMRAAEAKELLENKAFQWALLKLRKQWFQDLVTAGGGDLKSTQACARIIALEGLASELQVCINDYKMAVNHG